VQLAVSYNRQECGHPSGKKSRGSPLVLRRRGYATCGNQNAFDEDSASSEIFFVTSVDGTSVVRPQGFLVGGISSRCRWPVSWIHWLSSDARSSDVVARSINSAQGHQGCSAAGSGGAVARQHQHSRGRHGVVGCWRQRHSDCSPDQLLCVSACSVVWMYTVGAVKLATIGVNCRPISGHCPRPHSQAGSVTSKQPNAENSGSVRCVRSQCSIQATYMCALRSLGEQTRPRLSALCLGGGGDATSDPPPCFS